MVSERGYFPYAPVFIHSQENWSRISTRDHLRNRCLQQHADAAWGAVEHRPERRLEERLQSREDEFRVQVGSSSP